MNVSDIIVEVRDRDLVRRAQITDADLDGLVVVARDNDIGSWELRLPDTVLDETTGEWIPHAAARELRKEGAGLVVTSVVDGVPQTLLSGPMTSATFEADGNDLTGRWAFSGVSDAVLLADALAFPQPSNADPTTQTAANDTRSGAAESLLRQYVAYNICVTHAPAGRVTGLRSRLTLDGPDQARGATLTKSPRFQNLLELCQEIAFAGGLSFDIVQVGTELRFRVWRPEDRSKLIRMDMENDLLKSVTYGYGAASTTVAIVAGKGEGTQRLIVSRTSTDATDSETRWGRRIERFVDQRNAEQASELEQKGDEAVKEGAATASGLRATPTDADTMLYLRDWNKGDLVSVVVEGQEVKSPVSEAALGVSGSVVTIVATLGEASAFDVDAASQRRQEATASRVSAIERTVEVPTPVAPAWADITGKPRTFPATPQTISPQEATVGPSGWPMGLSVTATTATGWPSAYATVFTARQQDVRAFQLVTDKTSGRMWSRASTDGSTWGAFRTVLLDSVAWSEITSKPNLPYAMAAGSFVTNTDLPAGSYKDYTVTFPSGRFSVAPIVTFGAGSVRAGVAAEVAPTASGMTVRVFNVSGALTVASGTVIRWQAVQMAPTAAGG
ncbi:Gp37-like protein [Microbacterium sp. XT11]|uniref:Gp37-like protein n=1 Tax=Microbacterium sp. XT11 TaxID=367477 RepID=UPI0008310D01|nr:hypothetical protein [Microbacterium sp. XT11]